MPTLLEDQPIQAGRRYWLPGLSQDPDTRSVQVGLIWTLLVHLLLLLLAPTIFREEFTAGKFARPGANPKIFDIELSSEDFGVRPTQPQLPSKFVETNPEGNNNIPDKTDNFGAQNAQAAQPVPDKDSTLRMPKTEGRDDFKNETQVVTGRLEQPEITPPAPPMEEQPASETESQTQPKLQVPLPGYVKSQGDNADTFGTETVRFPEPSTGAEQRVEGDRNAQELAGSGARAAQASKPQPLPRPRLAQVRPGILQKRPVGVSNAGAVQVDAHFSEFGDYLQELIDIVQIQWERILSSSSIGPKPSTRVTISFRLNSEGQIAEILKVEGDAGEYGTNAALSGIRARAPYRPWTKAMVAVLGDSQVLTFSFYYW
jgi:hypothetical protein